MEGAIPTCTCNVRAVQWKAPSLPAHVCACSSMEGAIPTCTCMCVQWKAPSLPAHVCACSLRIGV